MTQPDHFTPAGASNYDSFAGFANSTQADWEAQIRGGLDGHFSAWSGICLMLESIPILGDLIERAGGPGGHNFGAIEAIFNGLQDFAEELCTLFLGSPQAGHTTPTSILGGAGGVFGIITDSPLFAGLLTLAEDTGNLVSDMLTGALNFANLLCSIFTGNPVNSSDTTPQSIMSGVNGIFDTINHSGFLSGIIGIANQEGSLILKLLDGIIKFLDSIWNIFAAFIPGGASGGATPQGFLDGFLAIFQPILDFIEGIMGAGTNVISGFLGIFTDIIGFFGNPLGLGTGSPGTGVLSGIEVAAENIVGGVLSPLISGISQVWETIIGALGGLGTGADGATEALQNIPDSAVGGLGAIAGQIYQATYGGGLVAQPIATIGPAIELTQAQFAAQQAAIAAWAADQTAAKALLLANSNTGGTSKSITVFGDDGAALPATDFSSTGPTAGDLCIRTAAIKGSQIGIKAANGVGSYFAIVNYLFATDDQSVQIVLGDEGAYDTAPTCVYTHCDTDHTTGAYIRIANDGVDVGSFTRSGGAYTYTPFTDGAWVGDVPRGATVEFGNDSTTWTVSVNGNEVLSVTGSVTMDAAHRTAAISMDRRHWATPTGGYPVGDYDSFRVYSLALSDNVTPTYPGSGAKIYRASVSTADATAGEHVMTSYFDGTEAATADITVDVINCKFTVSRKGWYWVGLRVPCGVTNTLLTNTYVPAVYRNGTVYEYGNGFVPGYDGTTGKWQSGFATSWVVPLAAGDYVQAAYNTNNTGTAFFGAGGGKTNNSFAIALLTENLN